MKTAWTDQIKLEGLVFFSHVGVLPEEKQNGQEFVIDVTFYCRRLAATATDLLAQTIDYGQAYQVIRQIVESARFDLIERLAVRVVLSNESDCQRWTLSSLLGPADGLVPRASHTRAIS